MTRYIRARKILLEWLENLSVLGITAPTGTCVQALPRNPLASSFDSMPRYQVCTSAQAIEKDFPHSRLGLVV
jgi:hypothetical protein